MRLPTLLKRPLVSLWNQTHQFAWWSTEQIEARIRRRYGLCSCCGKTTHFLRRPRAIPHRLVTLWGLSPDLHHALIDKETLYCHLCAAPLRSRRLALVILELYATPDDLSLAHWARSDQAHSLQIAEINLIPGIHAALKCLPGLAASDYHDPAGPPSPQPLPHQDLMNLTYPDESFDLVLTSETLEHVPDPLRALAEIHRILKPGGWHIFTLPMLPAIPRTFPRLKLLPDGTLQQLAPPISHPGGDWGYPVFTEWGADLPDILQTAGFAVDSRFGPPSATDLAQVWIAHKPL